ncbi:putative antitoxin, contains HTH domain [Candidatus Methanophagaceae archaeon]|nr:putative antitoxin, contains HTH domain [Methanophagales archaeon]
MKAKGMMKERVDAVIRSGIYLNEEELYDEAIRALFEVKSDLKMIVAVELYRDGEVSIEKAAEIAGVNVVQFKEILTHKGVTRGVGSGVEELMRKTEELKIATR